METHGREATSEHLPKICFELDRDNGKCMRARGHEGEHDHLYGYRRQQQQRDALQRALGWALLTLRGKWRDTNDTMDLTLTRACDALRDSYRPNGEGDDLIYAMLWPSSEDGTVDLSRAPVLAQQQAEDLRDLREALGLIAHAARSHVSIHTIKAMATNALAGKLALVREAVIIRG